MPRLEIRQLEFLRWRFRRGEIGGPCDGRELVLTGAQLLDAETERRILDEIMERIRYDESR